MDQTQGAPAPISAQSLFGSPPTDIEQLKDLALAASTAANSGTTLAEARGIAATVLQAAFVEAKELCARGQWAHAARIALLLCAHEPRSARFWFLAGTCLQREKLFREAVGPFVMALLGEQRPITLFRLGECFAAASEFGDARRAFGDCVELCRGNDEHRELQDAAADALNMIAAH